MSDIPDGYYTSAIPPALAAKPFGFSEIAWPSIPFFGGEQGQVDFLSAAAGRLTLDRSVNLHLFGWPWLTDLDANDEVGLIEHDGTEKLGYAAWIALSGGT